MTHNSKVTLRWVLDDQLARRLSTYTHAKKVSVITHTAPQTPHHINWADLYIINTFSLEELSFTFSMMHVNKCRSLIHSTIHVQLFIFIKKYWYLQSIFKKQIKYKIESNKVNTTITILWFTGSRRLLQFYKTKFDLL